MQVIVGSIFDVFFIVRNKCAVATPVPQQRSRAERVDPCGYIPKQVEESGLDASESSRDLTIKNGSILQYWPVFDRSNPGALAASKSRFFNLFGYRSSDIACAR